MKKKYILVVIILSFLPFYSSAITISIKANSKADSQKHQTNKASQSLLLPGSTPAASPTSLCEGETLTLTANFSEPIVPGVHRIEWTFPDGSTSTDVNPVINNVSSVNSGQYTLIIYDVATNLPIDTQSTQAVTVNTKIDPTFDATLPAICRGSVPPILSTTSTNGITGTWNPAVVSNTVSQPYIFTPDPGQCANVFSFPIFIVNNVTPTFSLPSSFCEGNTAPVLPNKSNNGIVGTWSPAVVSNTTSGIYTFTALGGQCVNPLPPVSINVTPKVTPTFTIPASICDNDPAPVLATTSSNGITGTWNPAIVTTTPPGDYNYTFTPNNPSQCSNGPSTIAIKVKPYITLTFDPITPSICENGAAPILPATSKEGIPGTWNPATVITTPPGNYNYTFTAATGECANNTPTISINVTPNVIPTFSFATSICENDPAPVLPLISDNGINGTWNTTTVVTTPPGDYIYTFTPNAGECIINPTTPITIKVKPYVTLTFDPIASSICENATAPILPATSKEGIPGTWNPATVITTPPGNYNYTFTAAAGECPNNTPTISVNVTPNVIPAFSFATSICENDPAPVLPLISDNGITGTWNTTTVVTTPPGNYTYTFTPDAGQCPVNPTTPIIIKVNQKIIPAFSFATSICENDLAPVLPLISDNGITGTWDIATVATTPPGDYTYTFTPNAGECTVNPTTPITIKVNQKLIPAFSFATSICQNDPAPVLPLISDNGITGTWDITTVVTTPPGDYTYTFTPNAGQCIVNPTTPITIKVKPYVTLTFDPIASSICENATAPILPPTSKEGIPGTWNPATIITTPPGNYNYIFTAAPGECTNNTPTISVNVTPNVIPAFSFATSICENDPAPLLPLISDNGITGTWDITTVVTTPPGDYIHTFTPDAGQCTVNPTTPITIKVKPFVTLTFDPIASSICENATAPILPPTSKEGIPGTWNPATVITTPPGNYNYTFTAATGECPNNTPTISINVNPSFTPTFSFATSICENDSAPVLPLISDNGITGTWDITTVVTTPPGDYIYTFTPNAGQCIVNPTTPITIKVKPFVTLTFDPIASSICENATAPILPPTSKEGIPGIWNPATVITTPPGNYNYTFTAATGECPNNTPTISINVTPSFTPAFSFATSICENDLAPVLPLISDNGITGTWDITTVVTTPPGDYIYTFTPDAGQCTVNPTTPITIKVIQKIIPAFSFATSICENDSAPVLPLISDNGITGTWDITTVVTTPPGDYIYTFTPNAGQCTVNPTTPITIKVIQKIIPAFSFATSICEGAIASVLPLISDNGIAGTWDIATVITTPPGDYIYTFTPNAGQCTVNPTTSITIKVNLNVIPTFSFATSICEGATAPVLPLISDNGIAGTWDITTVVTTPPGDYIYTFTPNAGQCTVNPTTPITIKVNQNVIPTFSFATSICEGSTAPVLPLISDNGITGTWDITTVVTTPPGDYIYTFTPNAGQCTVNPTTPITIKVNQKTVPIFNSIPDVCYGTATIPTLPATSTNGITGTWNPAIVSNTSPGDYIFTPDPGFCATQATLPIKINVITPVFNTIAPICQGAAAPTLPTTSNEGIIGTWFPLTVDTSVAGTFSYAFTPNPEQCAIGTSILIIISPTTATFTQVPAICNGDTLAALPTTSDNGVTGIWAPPAMDNTKTTLYTFTPASGQCATAPVFMTIDVNQKVIPTFTTIITAICSGETAPVLPLTSDNGITGTWFPTAVDNSVPGTVPYVFTPDTGLCATTASLPITVYPSPTDIAFTTTDVTNDKAEGTITITGVTSGVAPFEYSINNGSFSTNTIYPGLIPGDYTITVKDSNGCEFSTVASITSLCVFPSGISPNGDGLNDSLNLEGCNVSKLILYNRYGKEVNKFDNYTNQWFGTNEKGEHLPDGTYFYAAERKDGTTKSGWIYVSK